MRHSTLFNAVFPFSSSSAVAAASNPRLRVLAIRPDEKKTSSKQLCKQPFGPASAVCFSFNGNYEWNFHLVFAFHAINSRSISFSCSFSFFSGASARVTANTVLYIFRFLCFGIYTWCSAGVVWWDGCACICGWVSECVELRRLTGSNMAYDSSLISGMAAK